MEEIIKPRAIKHVYQVKDDYRTPSYLVTILDSFISQNGYKTIYCPFDTDNSEFVRHFKELGLKVINGDIKNGFDFFAHEIPADADCVISNPPFSVKLNIFKKCFTENKPFALLMNFQAAHYQEIGKLFYDIEKQTGDAVQFIIPDKKVSFDGKTSAFNTCYYTWKFTDKTHWIHLEHNNTNKHYKPAYSIVVGER